MGLSVANILLEVTGESADARKELADVARDLALFGREEAEAAAYVDTSEATRELDELKARLKQFAADDHSAEVNLRIAKAQADLTALKAELEKIDGEDIDVDIDVKRGIVERVGALSKQISDLGVEMDDTSGFGVILARGLGSIGASLTSLGPLTIGIAAILATTLGAALAALIASLTQAIGGIGALGIAFGAALVPGVLLAAGAIARFTEDSETAGTAAHALREATGSLFDSFKNATAGGADALFRGIADAARDLDPLIQALGPAFTRLGKAGGDAFRLLGEQFSSPQWQQFFISMTDSLAKLTPLFARSFGAFAKILANIAEAAMPFLIQGFRSLAQWLEGIAENTSNIENLRDGIGTLVDHLRTWLDLSESIGGAFLAFVRAAAPAGQAIAKWIGEVADRFSEWADSEEGRARIQSFFQDVLPLVKELLTFLGKLVVIILQITQFFAPLLTLAVRGLNLIADAISDVLEWLTKVDRALAINKWGDIFQAAWEAIKQIVTAPIEFVIGFAGDIVSKAKAIWQDVKGKIEDAIKFVINFAGDIAARARSIWRDVKGVITDGIRFVIQFANDIASRARSIWSSVKNAITDAIKFVLSLPSDLASRARNVWEAVKGVIGDTINFVFGFAGDIVGRAKDLWSKVKGAVSGAIDLVVQIVPDLSGLPGKVVDALGFANGVTDLWESMFAIVGERGPELAFLPQGTDIYTAGETRNILKALGRGASVPAATGAAPVAATGQAVEQNYYTTIQAPSSGYADPEIALALLDAKLRTRGGLGA